MLTSHKSLLRAIWSISIAAAITVVSCKPEPVPTPSKPDKEEDTTAVDTTSRDTSVTPVTPTSEVLAKWNVETGSYPQWTTDRTIAAAYGKGTVRYVLGTQSSLDRSAFKTDSNDNNPRITSPWSGDYWAFTSPVARKAGDMVKLTFRARMSAGSMRYWRLEYLDGKQWKVAGTPIEFPLSDGTVISYTADMYPGGSGDEYDKVVTGIASYTQPTDSVAFRFICVSNLTCKNGTIITTPSTTATGRLSSPAEDPCPPCLETYTELSGLTPAGTVCGYVTADGGSPVADVVVSDGYETTSTDGNGYYCLNSKKQHGYVFMSVPGGYEVPVEGIFPQSFQRLHADTDVCERCDFSLTKVDNDKARIYFLGDIHLANNTTTQDAEQFAQWGKDITANMATYSGPKYLVTLGDMTWDCYWYSRTYYYPQYIAAMDAAIPDGTPVYHTIGNHDHDMNATGDWFSVLQYKRLMCPTYYSFNIGKIHIVILDNIECTNATASMTVTSYRTYNKDVVSDELAWLKKDLAYVSKDTPLFVCMHAPYYALNGSDPTAKKEDMLNNPALLACLAGYTTHFITGHTHICKNFDCLSSSTRHFEHNAGAVCGAWWRPYHAGGIHLAADGAPGGYEIFDFDGKDFTWVFKGTGRDLSEQFVTYDLNQCVLSADKMIPNYTDATYASEWDTWTKYSASHAINFQQTNANVVLINVWDYDPSWKVEVTEVTSSGDKALTVTRIRSYDPLYLATAIAPIINRQVTSGGFSDPFSSGNMFKVTCSSATTPLKIKVTDRFGNVYTENMIRPKTFSVAAYKK